MNNKKMIREIESAAKNLEWSIHFLKLNSNVFNKTTKENIILAIDTLKQIIKELE